MTLGSRLLEGFDCEWEWPMPDCAEAEEIAESMEEDRGIAFPGFAFVDDMKGAGADLKGAGLGDSGTTVKGEACVRSRSRPLRSLDGGDCTA